MTEADELKLEIEKTTESLTSKLSEIGESLSPKAQIQKHPLLSVGLSVGAGIIVGKTLSGPSHGRSLVKSVAGLAVLSAAGRIGKQEFPEARPHIETIEAVVATKLAQSVAEHLSDVF